MNILITLGMCVRNEENVMPVMLKNLMMQNFPHDLMKICSFTQCFYSIKYGSPLT